MSLKHTWGINVKTDAGSAASQTTSYEAGAEVNVNDSAEASGELSVDDIAVTVAEIVSFFIISDKDVTLTVNDDGSPDQTITLDAGKMIGWNTDSLDPNPLTSTTITNLTFTNAGDSAAKIKASFLIDATT